jgi:hypothetical protein
VRTSNPTNYIQCFISFGETDADMTYRLVLPEINPVFCVCVCLFVFHCMRQEGANETGHPLQKVGCNFADTGSRYQYTINKILLVEKKYEGKSA